jgi:hypothetical protein
MIVFTPELPATAVRWGFCAITDEMNSLENNCATCGRINGPRSSTVLLVDGENFKEKIAEVFREAGKSRLEWHRYDYPGLLDEVLVGKDVGRIILYVKRESGIYDASICPLRLALISVW